MSKLCVMCGVEFADTVDHIPPKCIYPKPIPSDMNLNTVPACKKCNGSSTKEDELFKIIIGISTGESRSEQENVIQSMASTLGKNNRLGNRIKSTATSVNCGDEEDGLEEKISIPYDADSYKTVIRKIIKGLYWREKRQILNAGSKIQARPLNDYSAYEQQDIMAAFAGLKTKTLNNGTFKYIVDFFDDGQSLWALTFFDQHICICSIQK